jgi:hypothetical protein
MINIIYKIPTANNSDKHKDINNDNVIKHLESNKDSILDLAEKHYEYLVEALTNNAISVEDYSLSSSPDNTMLSSSSTFPTQLNQSNTYRIDDSGIYHNTKDDIAG